MKSIMTYIGYVMGILGFAGVVWTYATRTADSRYDVITLKNDVIELNNKMVTKNDFKVLRDTLLQYIAQSESTDKTIIASHNALQRSWKQYLKDNTINLEDFIKYMNGIEFELRYDSMNYKPRISIRKIK